MNWGYPDRKLDDKLHLALHPNKANELARIKFPVHLNTISYHYTIMTRILEYPTSINLSKELKQLRDSEFVVSSNAGTPGTALLLKRTETVFEPIRAVPDLYTLFY
jgi:hypothetical protein